MKEFRDIVKNRAVAVLAVSMILVSAYAVMMEEETDESDAIIFVPFVPLIYYL